MTDQEQEQRWLAIVPTAKAVGLSRTALDCLKSTTNPTLRKRIDPASKKKNKILYDYNDMVKWLDYHIGLHEVQIERLDAAAVVVLPSIHEKELVQ